MIRDEFYLTQAQDPHIARRRAIRKRYPEIKQLIGPNPYSSLLIFFLVVLQFTIAWQLKNQSLLIILIVSYVIGAYISAALYALIHEASHKLVFKRATANKITALLANLPLVTVGAMPFFKFHKSHHLSFNDYRKDVGVPTHQEAKWVGNNPLRKIIWLAFFPLFQWRRTAKHPLAKSGIDKWMLVNIFTQTLANAAVIYFLGIWSFIYLFLCITWSFGLHPLGTRVVQEHFVVQEDQETNNYTGLSKLFECNFGLHAEHHDFPGIPWNRLPKLSKIAKKEYQSIPKFRSRLLLMFDFIFNAKWNLYNNTIRIKNRA
ncbi:fatty acid desaturase [Teredinibacter sp. KSP-S5-2]|uniref:fatty acid desaturase n=1 Tax=Teredinibacter sp. KSP-S5-2 TaxID=3034506 RepID=UPI0029341A01|nr:fatty acid desaturase [Teredinibacter sp. KSP-S5-2]WNO08362.1 fatty acid desaturase [Teredinibacter sp. KSP-S5-2]